MLVVVCAAGGFGVASAVPAHALSPGFSPEYQEALERSAHEALERQQQKEAAERAAREAAEREAREAHEREAQQLAAAAEGRAKAEHEAARSARCAVPRLRGLSLTTARRSLRSSHCTLGNVREPRRHRGRLVVIAQRPAPGKSLPRSSAVSVTLGPAR